MLSHYFITIVLILFLINISYFNFLKISTKRIVFSLVCIETINVMAFYTDLNPGFGKYPLSASLPTFLVSFFLLLRTFGFSHKRFELETRSDYHVFFGFFLLLSTLFFEFFFFDGRISPSSFSFILLSLFIIIYDKIHFIDVELKKMLFVFNLSFCIMFPFTTVLEAFLNDNQEVISSDTLIYFFLGKPLELFLTILGYDVWVVDNEIHFVDLESDSIRTLLISEACSGLTSIYVFLGALVSYLYVNSKKFDLTMLLSLSIIGITISFIANLLRMSIIVIVGHHFGEDYLQWAHSNVGWIIFTFWIFLFWSFLEKYIVAPSVEKIRE